MGTNVQRAALAALGSPAAEVPRVAQLAESLEREAVRSQNIMEEDAARNAHEAAKSRYASIERIRARATALLNLFR